MKNQKLTVEDLKDYIGKYIWLIDSKRQFGGERKLVRVDYDNHKFWDETESYTNFEDMNTVIDVYGERPDCFDEMIKKEFG